MRAISPCLAILAAVTLPGCGAPDSEEAPAPSELVLAAPVHHLGELTREPMLVEHPSGSLFVAGYGSQVTGTDPRAVPLLWRSDDGGTSWSRVDVGTAEDGAIGNSDVDLAVAPDGTLYFISMGFDRSTAQGTHIAIGASTDNGATWTWNLLSETTLDDRPWVEVTPDGTAHAIWNDGKGISHATSRDRGQSWTEQERISAMGGSSHLAVGPRGELAVRVTPLSASGHQFDKGLELILTSVDGGASWSSHTVPGERQWSPDFFDTNIVPRWVEPLAWDAAGNLYHLWSEGTPSEGTTVRLARSSDLGTSWETFTLSSEAEMAYFPYLVARGDGELAATWFVSDAAQIVSRVALVRFPADAIEPDVLVAAPLPVDAWRPLPEGATGEARPDTGGEYLPVAFLSSGELGVVAPIQDSRDDRFGFTFWRVEARAGSEADGPQVSSR